MSEHEPDHYLPRVVEPRKLANAQASFERPIKAEDLSRLSELSLNLVKATVQIQFDRNDQGRPELRGHVSAELHLECQRCLEPMQLLIERDIHLGIVWDEAQADALPRGLDPWIAGEDQADLIDIIEEEILLEIPVVARHDTDCLNPDLLSVGEGGKAEVGEQKVNPFDMLAQLKGKH